jgi:SAM-dependent methyltransferase
VPGGISFDRVAPIYDVTRALPPGVEQSVADLLARVLGDERTLELGAGTGRWARPLEKRGVPIVGVDLGRAMLTVARSKGFGRAVQADAVLLPFRDDAFDGALASHLLHLVYDVPAVLDELARVITGRFRSLLLFETARPDLSEQYTELAEQGGSHVRPPGLAERELARRLVPDRVRDAVVFHSRAPARIVLDTLASRALRDTWEVPETRHVAIIEELRARYDDAEILTDTRVELAEWDRGRLAGFAARLRATGSSPADTRVGGRVS